MFNCLAVFYRGMGKQKPRMGASSLTSGRGFPESRTDQPKDNLVMGEEGRESKR